MKSVDPLIFLELQVVHKIIADETWLEGERRGCAVDPHDPVVVAVVCEVIARIGADLRASLMAKQQNRPEPSSEQDHPMAA